MLNGRYLDLAYRYYKRSNQKLAAEHWDIDSPDCYSNCTYSYSLTGRQLVGPLFVGDRVLGTIDSSLAKFKIIISLFSLQVWLKKVG